MCHEYFKFFLNQCIEDIALKSEMKLCKIWILKRGKRGKLSKINIIHLSQKVRRPMKIPEIVL